MKPEDVRPFALYCVEGKYLQSLALLSKRLYSEQRMTGDEMRDAAQTLDYLLRSVFESDQQL
jgi:hypothetical protein